MPSADLLLVLTLLVLVIVAIAASTFAEKVASAVELAQKSRQNTQTIIDMAATRAEILYRLGTTSITMDGLGRGNTLVALDNRPYRGLGDTLVHLQDNRGLLNLNQTNDDRLLRFLGIMGIPAEQRSHLIDTLRDYIDADKLEHLNGAEEPQYLARQLVPPTNNYLTTPWEVRRIIGWRDAPQLWQNSRFIDLTTTSTMGGLNPNTAPVEVLATLPGMTEEPGPNPGPTATASTHHAHRATGRHGRHSGATAGHADHGIAQQQPARHPIGARTQLATAIQRVAHAQRRPGPLANRLLHPRQSASPRHRERGQQRASRRTQSGFVCPGRHCAAAAALHSRPRDQSDAQIWRIMPLCAAPKVGPKFTDSARHALSFTHSSLSANYRKNRNPSHPFRQRAMGSGASAVAISDL